MIQCHSFHVGSFECFAINDGIRRYEDPAHWLYPDVPQGPLHQALRDQKIEPTTWKEWISDNTCLAIKTGNYIVLVDTGSGSLEPTTGLLPQGLKNIGIDPKDVDIVIHTHAHPDHIGGNALDKGRKLGYPNARYFIGKGEYNFWMSNPDLSHLKFPPKLEPLKKIILQFPLDYLPPVRSQLNFVGHDMEIVPGIYAFETNGHTPGHMSVSVSSRKEELLVVGDALIMPINVENPEWNACPDVLPQQAISTRYKLLVRAAAGNGLVLGFHMPFPGLGHVISQGGAWKWQPIKIGK